MSGPWGGDFCYEPDESEGLILLAGGTGLAPLKAIARAALEADPPDREIHVYHGVRSRAELYDVDFWEGLAATHPPGGPVHPLPQSRTMVRANRIRR